MITFNLTTLKRRNPLALAARLRHAGSHRVSRRTDRQQGQQALRAELRQQHPPSL